MNDPSNDHLDRRYVTVVCLLTFIFPVLSLFVGHLVSSAGFSLAAFGKWFIFYAVGARLFLAGIRQTVTPAFTARAIFRLKGTESYPVIRELGFANGCFGLIGLISLCVPQWRPVSAFGSGLYYGLAGVMHAVKRNAGVNEKFALYTDGIIFVVLATLFVFYWNSAI